MEFMEDLARRLQADLDMSNKMFTFQANAQPSITSKQLTQTPSSWLIKLTRHLRTREKSQVQPLLCECICMCVRVLLCACVHARMPGACVKACVRALVLVRACVCACNDGE